MTSDSPRRRPPRVSGGIAQLPWRAVTNPFKPVEILSADQVEPIRLASLRILREIGFEVLGDPALELFAGAGAEVDRTRRSVRLDAGLVEELVAKAPAEFRLYARSPERDVILGGNHVVFSSVGGPAFVTDLDRGRRAGNFADFVDYVKVISSLNIIHQEAGGPLEPTARPGATRHLDMYQAFIGLLDKTWHCLGAGRRGGDAAD